MIKDLWYKNTVIYSLDLETFMDTNGDGIGDFEGLIRRLDYLHTLGIGAIWLAPFQLPRTATTATISSTITAWTRAMVRAEILSSSSTRRKSAASKSLSISW
ncbi:MAG TPA: alpha-amylase family glycosyl hydrolase [Candidatus Udaeobacter sp.]|nr:alpha-amylase family glycosyl hydrolase [Candidatus Udaeobacter sp.]